MKPILSLVLILLAVQVGWAGEVKVQYRLLGLFQPDRVEDLHRQGGVFTLRDTDVPADIKIVDVNYDLALVTYAYDPDAKQFKQLKPEQILERVNDRLRSNSRGAFSVTAVSTLKPEQLKQERILVAGLDCKGCAYSAYRAVAIIDGVERAVVSFKDGHVTAWIDPQKTNRQILIEALKRAEVDVTEQTAK